MTLNLGQVARGEPDPALFIPPADYTRRDITLPPGMPAESAVQLQSSAVITAVKKNP